MKIHSIIPLVANSRPQEVHLPRVLQPFPIQFLAQYLAKCDLSTYQGTCHTLVDYFHSYEF